MSQSRNVVYVLLLLAIAGVAWLWWSSADGNRPGAPPAPPVAPEANANGATGFAEVVADPAGTEAATIDGSGRVAVGANEATLTPSPAILRVTALWPEAVPAANVMIYLRRSQSRMPYTAFARGLTDELGAVLFTDVGPGPSSLESDRGDRMKVTVVAGEQDVTFELEGGVSVEGTVTDPGGAKVAGAEVWLQTPGTTWSGGRVMAVTGAAGRFALEQVNPEHSIGAVAANFAPSRLVDLDIVDTSKPPAIVDLVLERAGGRLEGTVTDTVGKPISGALIAAGKRERFLDHRGRRIIEQWSPRVAETDENGYFAVVGIAAGKHPVAIRADGFGLWRDEVVIAEGKTTVISPQLAASAVLTGTVTDGDGAPIAGAAVRAYDLAPGTGFLAGGQIDFDATFGYRGAISNAAGEYRIEGITPGTVHLFAQLEPERHEGVSLAYTTADLQVDPGSEVTWDPVIANGLAIEGVVLYRDGFPMPGLFITLADEKEGGKEHVIVSDRDGVFRFLCLEDSTYQIRVQYWDAPEGSPPLQATGVTPNSGRTELRAPFDKPVEQKDGVVIGRIGDVAGRIRNLKAVRVVLHSDQRWFREDGKIENGAFRFERVKPCRFRLSVIEDSNALAVSDWFELLAAATVDVGVLTTELAGGAKFTFTREEGTESFEPTLYLKREGDARSTVIKLGRRSAALSDNLTPGDYRITAFHRGMVSVRDQLRVTVGQTTEVRLRLRAGALMRCEVWWPEGESRSISRHYRILDSDGKLFHEYEGDLLNAPTRPHQLNCTIPPGRWKVEFTTDDGLRGEAGFEVPNATDELKVRVDLR